LAHKRDCLSRKVLVGVRSRLRSSREVLENSGRFSRARWVRVRKDVDAYPRHLAPHTSVGCRRPASIRTYLLWGAIFRPLAASSYPVPALTRQGAFRTLRQGSASDR